MDTNLFQPGLFDRCAAIPQQDKFEKMTLAHFSVWYDSVYIEITSHRAPVGVTFSLDFNCKAIWNGSNFVQSKHAFKHSL